MKFAGIGLVVSLVLLASGCGPGTPTHESLTKDMIGLMNEQADVLAKITDGPSATAAKPKLEALAERMKTMKADAEKIGEPSKEAEEQLKQKYEPEVKKASQRMMAEMMRVMAIPAAQKVLQDAFQKMK